MIEIRGGDAGRVDRRADQFPGGSFDLLAGLPGVFGAGFEQVRGRWQLMRPARIEADADQAHRRDAASRFAHDRGLSHRTPGPTTFEVELLRDRRESRLPHGRGEVEPTVCFGVGGVDGDRGHRHPQPLQPHVLAQTGGVAGLDLAAIAAEDGQGGQGVEGLDLVAQLSDQQRSRYGMRGGKDLFAGASSALAPRRGGGLDPGRWHADRGGLFTQDTVGDGQIADRCLCGPFDARFTGQDRQVGSDVLNRGGQAPMHDRMGCCAVGLGRFGHGGGPVRCPVPSGRGMGFRFMSSVISAMGLLVVSGMSGPGVDAVAGHPPSRSRVRDGGGDV
ncbi:hypothetical protein ACIO52_02590 [Nocardia sp. NPDC087230]|uniref:hypothetical protein n=1 Tax=Nocardia sp. NPDC087230 TaxID=3364331 RepID=UPI0037FFC9DD